MTRGVKGRLAGGLVVGAVALGASALPGYARAADIPPTATSPASAKLQAARTFAFGLGVKLTSANVARLGRRDLVVVDGEDASPAVVARLHARGALVLGYLSVGSVESWRSWFPLLKPYRLEPLGDWPGERYTDVSQSGARDVLADQLTPQLLSKGFDGLFLDLIDMTEDHPAQMDGMIDVVQRISARVHAGGGVLMAQNGDSVIDRFTASLDAWNREDTTGTYDFDRERYVRASPSAHRSAVATLRRLRAAGLVVTSTDYFASPRAPGAARAVRIACAAGALPMIGDINLRRISAQPQRCPSG